MVFFDDFTAPMKSHDHRRSLKGAHHHNNPFIFANVSNRFNSAPDQVEVNQGFVVQDADRVTIFGGTIDMAIWIKWSRCHEKDPLQANPLLNPFVDFLVDLAHSVYCMLSITVSVPEE